MFQSTVFCSNVITTLKGSDEYAAKGSGLLAQMESFEIFFTDEPLLPRYQKRPKWLDEGVTPHCYESPKEKYRYICFEVLDLIKGEREGSIKLIFISFRNLLM